MVVAVGAGIIAAFGLYYTHRNHKLAQERQPCCFAASISAMREAKTPPAAGRRLAGA
jgi:hypothetical protein